MKITFLQKDIFARPAIMALSAVLRKAGHECDVIIGCIEKDITGAALDNEPDVIAFSLNSYEANWMNKVGKELRQRFNGTIICGGPHPTSFPEQTIQEEYLDAICVGEGEEALPEFLAALENDENTTGVANFLVKKDGQIFINDVRPLIEDLDLLPFWDRDIYEKYPAFRVSHGGALYHYSIMASRGCLYDCSFCLNSTYKKLYRDKGTFFRRRSVYSVIEELKELKGRNVKQVDFLDETFTLPPRSWLDDFLRRYRDEIAIPFKMQTTANLLNDDLMAKLKEANCHTISMGIESGNEHYRKHVLRKHVSDSEILTAAALARKYGINFQCFNMAGCPGETLEMVFQTYDLNRKIKPDLVRCTFFHPIPGTELYNHSVSCGLIDEPSYIDSLGHKWPFFNPTIKMDNMRRISNLQKLMGPCITLRFPRWLTIFLTGLPLTRLYRLMLGVNFVIGFYKIDNISLPYLVRLSVKHYARDVMRD
ncbi:MAG: radical SAM protein [Dehalococcoidia bacterium]